jgi:2-methylisocitrate lyase-like PEP mutase family enzyme
VRVDYLKRAAELRRLLGTGKAIIAPGVFDALGARIVEKVGFEAALMGGHSVSLSRIGQTDVGLMTEAEVVDNARLIANAINIPLVADADNGYGNAINVMRTVRDFEGAGVAGIHIEDQEAPKRCGHMKGKRLISEEEMVGKIRAALDAREDDDFVIIARTDARGAAGGSLDLAIKRGLAYAEAGADLVHSEFTAPSGEEAERFAKAIHAKFPGKPLYFNYSTAFKWHQSPVSFDRLEELGYKLIVLPLQVTRSMLAGGWDFLYQLKAKREKAVYEQEKRLKGHATEDYHEFGGFPDIVKLEEKYLPKEEVQKKYATSEGLIKIKTEK